MPDDPSQKSEKSTEKAAESAGAEAAAEPVAKPTTAAPADAKSADDRKDWANDEKPATADAAAADDDDDDTAEDESADDDAFRPEAIAKRIEKIGGETDVERQAREEEAKLAERRRLQKKKGKRGLEAAASKKLSKIGDKPVKRAPSAAAVAADADPLLERTAKISEWLRGNQRVVGALVGALVLSAAGFGGWTWWQKKKDADASVLLAAAVNDQQGKIGDPAKVDPDKPKDPHPIFATVEARRDSALAKYKEVEAKYAGTGAAILARLGEGSIQLDKHDPDAAIAAFNDVKASALAAADAEVRGRALEGLGFAYELKAQAKPEDKEKELDLALKAFKELEQTDVRGFKELGQYHQARVTEAKGNKPVAIEILTKLRAKLHEKPTESEAFPYLETAVDDRLGALDPSAVPHKPPHGPRGGMGGMGGGMGGIEDLLGPDGKLDMSDPRVMQLIQQQMQSQGAGGAPGAPKGPPGGAPPPVPVPVPGPKK